MKGHRRFAALFDWLTRHESVSQRELRQSAAGAVSGRVLEIGVGTGANWEYLPEGIDYTGIEPDEYMLARARERANEQGRDLRLETFDVQELPFEDATFDSALVTFTFCTVPDAVAGLREVRRVLRPGGELVFVEHVRSEGRIGAGVQAAITPLTRRLLGGCEWNRDTGAAIETAGLEIVEIRRHRGVPPVIAGRALRPEG